MAETLIPELAAYQGQFRDNRVAARELCEPLTAERFNWRPADGGWSVAECLTHLNISAALFSEAALRAARDARAQGREGTGPFRYGLLAKIMLWSLNPENRRRYKAPRKFLPPPTDYEVELVLGEFIASERRWTECLEAASGLDLARVKVPSPAMALLRFPLGATFAIQATHERRHLQQARAVTTDPNFPA